VSPEEEEEEESLACRSNATRKRLIISAVSRRASHRELPPDSRHVILDTLHRRNN